MSPNELMQREWTELPVAYLSDEDYENCQELFVWPTAPGDPQKRTLACVNHSSGLYVIARDGSERVTQLWAVKGE